MLKGHSNILSIVYSFAACCLLCSCGGYKYDWFSTYQDDKNDVYGTYIIKKYLDNLSGEDKPEINQKLSKYFEPENNREGNYIFIGEAMLVDDFDAEALGEFVKQGNNAFIATNVFPNTISNLIFKPCREKEEEVVEDYNYEEESDDDWEVEELEDYILDSIEVNAKPSWMYYDFEHLDFIQYGSSEVKMNLVVAQLKTDSVFRTVKNQEPRYRNWYFLHDSLACIDNNNITVHGLLNDSLINYIEIPFGDGAFHIHTSPFVFTNVNLLNDTTSQYIENIFSNGVGKSWHWDEYSRTSLNTGKRRNSASNVLSNKGPLTYILKQRSLKWAWYSLLAMGGFFMVFRAKRKQRVVPVIEENANTSLAFINTIGTLYFNKNDHKQLCKDQMQLWLEDVRHYYRINTSKLDEDFVILLSAKSKKSKEEIQGLLDYYQNILNGEFVSENTMVTFYQKLNQFSIQTKS